jgi:hypothetical protein
LRADSATSAGPTEEFLQWRIIGVMQAVYLYANAALYLVFALWCTFAAKTTAASLGYTALSSGGRSEYLVIYGGLQLGLAGFFWFVARQPDLNPVGVVFALILYGPIVAYRLVTLFRLWPVAPLTIATGVLESLLLLVAIWLYFGR